MATGSIPRRFCQVIHIYREHFDEYKKIHSNVWPKVLARIHDSNIREYTINYLPSPPYPSPDPNIVGLLIGSFTYIGNDFEGDMAKMAADEVTREWWKLTDPMQSSLIDGAKGSEYGAWWHSCEELFYAP